MLVLFNLIAKNVVIALCFRVHSIIWSHL